MNRTFLIASISNTWHNSIHLAEQLMTQAKYCGASAIHIDLSNLQKPHFMFLKSYADKFNLPMIATVDTKDQFEWLKEADVKLHIMTVDHLNDSTKCASFVQTGLPTFVSLQGWQKDRLPLGNEFKNVKYLVDDESLDYVNFEGFNSNVNGVIINSTEKSEFAYNSVRKGAKVVLCEFGLGKSESHLNDDELKLLRCRLNEAESNLIDVSFEDNSSNI